MFLPGQDVARRAVKRFPGPTERFAPSAAVLSNIKNERSFDAIRGDVDAWRSRSGDGGRHPKKMNRDQITAPFPEEPETSLPAKTDQRP
ncbi:hypothetical protein GGR01_000312 [Acetobacter oeni]|nr:hypothetical protein [Acetobacter oeni]